MAWDIIRVQCNFLKKVNTLFEVMKIYLGGEWSYNVVYYVIKYNTFRSWKAFPRRRPLYIDAGKSI